MKPSTTFKRPPEKPRLIPSSPGVKSVSMTISPQSPYQAGYFIPSDHSYFR
ncbi:unnamed protein product [Brassica oleracea]